VALIVLACQYAIGFVLAIPLLALRTAYGLLQVFYLDTLAQPWNPIYGSAVSLVLMALLPEYIILVMYIGLGFRRAGSCSQQSADQNSEAVPKGE